MSTIVTPPPRDSASAAPATMNAKRRPTPRRRVWTLAASHGVTDFFSVLPIALLPVIEGRGGLTTTQGAVLITAGGMSSGLIQPIVAWLSDRLDTRIFASLGILVASIAIAGFAFVNSFAALLALQIVALAGVGAYHPIGAATMGQFTRTNRSFGVAIFFVMGMVGHWVGNIAGPQLVALGGLESLAGLILPAAGVALALQIAIGSAPHRHTDAHSHASRFSVSESRRRWFAVGVLFAGNVIRFTVNMMMFMLVVRWAEATVRAGMVVGLTETEIDLAASKLNGLLQASLVVGMGIGGLGAGRFVRAGREKWPMVLIAWFGAPLIWLLPFTNDWVALLVAIGVGIGYASTVPLTLALSQRLLPHRTSLASGIVLGGTWIFSSLGPILAQFLADEFGLRTAFGITAVALASAGALTMALPADLLRSSAQQDTLDLNELEREDD
ncbi:MAG: MFS transporter [Phycisphaerales bacterium]